jgi:hypothetical protein
LREVDGMGKFLNARLRLVSLDQTADALRIGFAVAVTGNRIGAARGFDDDLGPEDAGGNMDGGNLRHGDALFVAAKQPRLDPGDALRTDDQTRREEEIALRPTARREGCGGRRVHRVVERSGHVYLRFLSSAAVPAAVAGASRPRTRYTHSSAPFFQTQM